VKKIKTKNNIVQTIRQTIHKNRIKNFRPKISLLIDKQSYIIKTAENTEEFQKALRLRHDVFIEEILHKKKFLESDIDRFDKKCDHLIILDKKTNQIIGTYRLNSSLYTKKFYSATEFHMKYIVNLPGNKLELGRACVHKDYRNGITISLLWEGIMEYLMLSNTKYMFGCSSVKTMDKEKILSMIYYFKDKGHMSEQTKISPRGKFRIHGMKKYIKHHKLRRHDPALDTVVKDMVPSLLNSYLKAGAKICGIPALDRSFRCVDFLTLLDVEQLKQSYGKKIGQ
jgi:putative hemolysin